MDLGDTLVASFNEVVNDLVTALPAIIGAIVILIVGWIIASILGRVVRGLLGRAGVDRAFEAHGRDVYGDRTDRMRPSSLVGTVVKWIVFLVFVIAAANFLGWPQVSELLDRFISWIPNLIVAAIILIVAPVVARIVRRAVESGSANMGAMNPTLLGRIVEIAIIAFAVVVAINQVGIASDLVNIVFIGVVFALALAFGLAFGLGGREVAGEVAQSWYDRSRQAAARAQTSTGSQTQSSTPPVNTTRPTTEGSNYPG